MVGYMGTVLAGGDLLSDVHFTDFVYFASVRSTYCACAMVVGAGVVTGVHVVYMQLLLHDGVYVDGD